MTVYVDPAAAEPLVGHSTGAIAVALAAPALADFDIRGAFLVAPPADDSLSTPIPVMDPDPTGCLGSAGS